MKRTVMMWIISVSLIAPARAQKPPDGGLPAKTLRMESSEPRIRRLRALQEYELKLHDLMHQIREAKTDEERERLKEEHLRLLETRISPHDPNLMQEHIQELMEEGTETKEQRAH